MKPRPFAGVGLAVLFGLVACSSESTVGAGIGTDPMSQTISILVAGFVKAAGIT